VLIHATHEISSAVRRHRRDAGLDTTAELHVTPESGPGKNSVHPTTANGLAAGIADAIRSARREYFAREVDLYIAAPWSLAALIGWHLGSTGPVTLFEALPDRTSYARACRLS
jgi:hypothetical protein